MLNKIKLSKQLAKTGAAFLLATTMVSKAVYVPYGGGADYSDPLSTGSSDNFVTAAASSSASGSTGFGVNSCSFSGSVFCSTWCSTDPMYFNGIGDGIGAAVNGYSYCDYCGWQWQDDEGGNPEITLVSVQSTINLSGEFEVGGWIYADNPEKVFYWAGYGTANARAIVGPDPGPEGGGYQDLDAGISGGSTNGVSSSTSGNNLSQVTVTDQDVTTGEGGYYERIQFNMYDSVEYEFEGRPDTITMSPQLQADSSSAMDAIGIGVCDWEDFQVYALGNSYISGSVDFQIFY